MKPVDSTEGEEREDADVDAPSPDGFTILDSDSSADSPNHSSTNGEQADADAAGKVASETSVAEGTDTETDPEDTDTETDSEDTGAAGPSNDESVGTVASSEGGAGSGKDEDELSFDEWLAAAERSPGDTTGDAARADRSNRTGATKKARARKVKNRRSRRSRTKPEGAADSEPVNSETDSPTSDLGTGETTSERADSTGDSISDIMAELLAAAEQSSLGRGDQDEITDTEVELDPEDVSEFAGEADLDPSDSDGPSKPGSDVPATTDEATDDEAVDTDDQADKKASDEPPTDVKAETDKSKTKADKKADETKPDNKAKTADKSSPAIRSDSDTKDETDKSQTNKANTDKAKTDKAETDKKSAGETTSDATETAQAPAAVAQSPVEPKTAGPILTPLRRPERPSRVPTVVIATVAAVVGLYAIFVAGWAIDTMTHRGEAMRGVRMAGVAVGGSDQEGLRQVITDLDADLGGRETTVTIDGVEVVSNPISLGLHHDSEPMIDEALDARRGGFIALRPIRWLFHLFTTENIPAQYAMDASVADAAVEEIISPELSVPVEPEMELQGSLMAVVPGASGVTVDSQEIVDQLPLAIGRGQPYAIELTALDARPMLTDEAVAGVVDDINQQTEQPVIAQVLDQQVEVSPRMLKSWMTLTVDDDQTEWAIDEDAALEDLKPLFPALGSEDQQARFSVVDGEPIIVPASETVICCEPRTLPNLADAIKRPIPALIEPPEDADEDEEPVQPLRRARLEPAITGQDEGVAELESLGIVEEVSTFTTPHACCQNRVINIQRFADLMQGVIIRPGEELSLNEFVGRRTRENGFVADGAIVLGNFEPQVGGGISQYATTFFNASFFAGIEFVEYQSHSIYISRYPRGREATISWRRPDLKVHNNTDYGILVWNDYTDTSITVTFYSTKNREVEALPLRRSSDRQCRIDITPRLITFPDGTTEEDSVFALYRPGQGLDCNGNSTTPEEDEAEQANNTPTPPPPDPEPNPDPDPDEGEILPPGG